MKLEQIKLKPQSPHTDEHEWWVFSTAVLDVVLMVECRKTGSYGIVRNPTLDEWEAGFYAPSKPYRWHENERVEIVTATA